MAGTFLPLSLSLPFRKIETLGCLAHCYILTNLLSRVTNSPFALFRPRVSSLCSSLSLARYSIERLDPSLYSLTALDCSRIAVTAEAQRGKSPGLGWQRVEHEVGGGVVYKPGQLTLV